MRNVHWDDATLRMVWTPLEGGMAAHATDAVGPVGSFGIPIFVMPLRKLGLCQLRRGDEIAAHWGNPHAVRAVAEHCLVARTLQIGDINGRNFLTALCPRSMPVAIDAAEQARALRHPWHSLLDV